LHGYRPVLPRSGSLLRFVPTGLVLLCGKSFEVFPLVGFTAKGYSIELEEIAFARSASSCGAFCSG